MMSNILALTVSIFSGSKQFDSSFEWGAENTGNTDLCYQYNNALCSPSHVENFIYIRHVSSPLFLAEPFQPFLPSGDLSLRAVEVFVVWTRKTTLC